MNHKKELQWSLWVKPKPVGLGGMARWFEGLGFWNNVVFRALGF